MSKAYHLLHLHLDIKWWCLIMLHHLEIIHNATHQVDDRLPLTHSQPSDLTSLPQSPFDQCVHFIQWDIITIMSLQAVKVKCICSITYQI